MNATQYFTRERRERKSNGSWLACLLAVGFATLAPRAVAQPILQLGTNGVAQGHAVQVPLWLAGASDLAGLQVDLLIDFRLLESNGFSVSTPLPGVLADGGSVASNRLRVLLLSTNRTPLPNGLVASLNFAIHTNASNGWMQVPLRTQPAAVGITMATNGTCGAAMIYRAGELFVGDAFGFVPDGGRVQFRATDAAGYLFQASTNLMHWTNIGTNIGLNDLVIWIDRDVTNYPHRFYRSRAP